MLLSLSIETANHAELVEMAKLRDIPITDDATIQKALRQHYGFADPIPVGKDGKESYTLTILSSDAMHTASQASLVILEGNVVVQFTMEGTDKPKTVSADRMVMDINNTLLSAQGSVVYEDNSSNAPVQLISGSMITLDWTDQTLSVRGGATTTERKNSDDKQVSFYTFADSIEYHGGGGGIFFEHGFLTTNKDEAYSSITAEKLSFLHGGDMMVSNAYLSIGRIPVLWVPFFFFPGARMAGNPAIGLQSNRGMFVNTTTEIYGIYPNISSGKQSSFTSLLAVEQDSDLASDGVLYGKASATELSAIQNWAKQSGSYLSLLGDAYEQDGIALGLDAKNILLGKTLTVTNAGMLALHPKGTSLRSSYGDFPFLRYFGENSFVLDTSWADLQLDFPFYSDPSAKRLYANRLATFSFDSVFGKSQEFPSTINNDVSTYKWKANGTVSLPKSLTTPLVSNLTINKLTTLATWKWEKESTQYQYVLQEVSFPELQIKMGGTLLSFETQDKTTKTQEAIPLSSTYEPKALLAKPYRAVTTQKQQAKDLSKKRKISLGYTVDEQYIHTADSTSSAISIWNEDWYLYSQTKGSIVLDAQLDPDYFTFRQEVLPNVTFTEDKTKTIFQTQYTQFSSSTVATIPLLGLTYTLNQRLYMFQQDKSYDSSGNVVLATNEQLWAFNKTFVTTHQIQMSKTFDVFKGKLSPSLTTVLYPLTQSVLPALSYTAGAWTLNGSLSYVDTNSQLTADKFSSSVAYATDTVKGKFSLGYDIGSFTTNAWDPVSMKANASLFFFNKQVSLSENIDFKALSTKGVPNYFSNITSDFSIPFLNVRLMHEGGFDSLKLTSMKVVLAAKDLSFQWWKRRIRLTLGFDASLFVNFLDIYDTSLAFTAKVGFSIAEFLDFTFSVKSANNGMYTYFDQNNNFSMSLLMEDLLRSFDFIGTGRTKTQFNLSSLSLQLVHYMDDWSLNCKYSGSVVLSNNKYSWVPVVSVFLQWDSIPELKVEENWTQNNTVWARSSSS